MALLVKKKSPQREYELTYVVGSGYTTAELNSLHDSIVALIGKNDGSINQTIDWGKKSLAYPIKKDGKTHVEGTYTHLEIKMPAGKVAALNREIDLKKEILRSLLVVKN